MGLTGLFGGTFDPIHLGHLDTVQEVCVNLAMDEVRFLPAATPPHRAPPEASAEDRLEMVRLAIADYRDFVVDGRELERPAPSYTYDTLRSFRSEFPDRIFCLIMGRDALLGLPQWHRWKEVLKLAHIAVMERPGWEREETLPDWWQQAQTFKHEDLRRSSGGRIHPVAVTPMAISATGIRQYLREGREVTTLLPPAVLDYINHKGLYDKHHQNLRFR